MTQVPPPPPAVPQKNNTLAVVSLVCGIASIIPCFSCLGGIAAIVCGSIAKKQIAQGKGGGAPLAKWGVILGIIGILVGLIVGILYAVLVGFAAATGGMKVQ
jgi:hypothetical protein